MEEEEEAEVEEEEDGEEEDANFKAKTEAEEEGEEVVEVEGVGGYLQGPTLATALSAAAAVARATPTALAASGPLVLASFSATSSWDQMDRARHITGPLSSQNEGSQPGKPRGENGVMSLTLRYIFSRCLTRFRTPASRQ